MVWWLLSWYDTLWDSMTYNNTKKDKKLHCGCMRSEDHNRRWKYISSFSHYKHSIRIVFLSDFLPQHFLLSSTTTRAQYHTFPPSLPDSCLSLSSLVNLASLSPDITDWVLVTHIGRVNVCYCWNVKTWAKENYPTVPECPLVSLSLIRI